MKDYAEWLQKLPRVYRKVLTARELAKLYSRRSEPRKAITRRLGPSEKRQIKRNRQRDKWLAECTIIVEKGVAVCPVCGTKVFKNRIVYKSKRLFTFQVREKTENVNACFNFTLRNVLVKPACILCHRARLKRIDEMLEPCWREFAEKNFKRLQNLCTSFATNDFDNDLWDEIVDKLPTIFDPYDPYYGDTEPSENKAEAYAWGSLKRYVAKAAVRRDKRGKRFKLTSDEEIKAMQVFSKTLQFGPLTNQQADEVLRVAKRTLTDTQYYILYYHAYEGFAMPDVAAAQKISTQYAYRLYADAKAKLRAMKRFTE